MFETVSVKSRPIKGFRTVTKRRGKKFCFFVPWKLKAVQDLRTQHGFYEDYLLDDKRP